MKKRRSPLDTLTVAAPCTQSWASMAGDDRVRHCGKCEKPVHDLGRLTRAEAEQLLATLDANGHPPCVQFRRDRKGRVVSADSHGPRWIAAMLAFAVSLFASSRGESGDNAEKVILRGEPVASDVQPELGKPVAPTPVPKPPPKSPKPKPR